MNGMHTDDTLAVDQTFFSSLKKDIPEPAEMLQPALSATLTNFLGKIRWMLSKSDEQKERYFV